MAMIEIPESLHERCQLAALLMGTSLELWLLNVLPQVAEGDISDKEAHGGLENWTAEV